MFVLTGIPDNQLATILAEIPLDGSRLVTKFRAADGTWTIIVAGPGSAQPGDGSAGIAGTTDTTEFNAGMLLPGRPSIRLDPAKKVASGQDGISIDYRGHDACPYGKSATAAMRPFAYIVVHHTSDDHDTDWYVQYQLDGDTGRDPPGHYGYHFYISPAGKIVQGAPLNKRTNHVSPASSVRLDFGKAAQNTNAIGVCCVGAWNGGKFNPTKKQVREAENLVFALCDVYAIPFANVFGHGEIQSNRHSEEGNSIAKAIRAW